MEDIKLSDSFLNFIDKFELNEPMEKIKRRTQNGVQSKSMLSFVYKPGSSICIKIANEIADEIGIKDYVGISYFSEDRMFMLSAEYASNGVLYPVCYNKSDKKYRCYRKELFKELTDSANITFDSCTCVSYHSVKYDEHPKLGKIALVYIDEN